MRYPFKKKRYRYCSEKHYPCPTCGERLALYGMRTPRDGERRFHCPSAHEEVYNLDDGNGLQWVEGAKHKSVGLRLYRESELSRRLAGKEST